MIAKTVKACSKNSISIAVTVLRKGGIVIYPTETSYGIGADAMKSKVVRKISGIKGRGKEKPIPIIVFSLNMAKQYAFIDAITGKLAGKFMPGPLTIIPRKKARYKYLGGFRIPGNKFALELAKRFGKPITATSANKSGKPPLYKINDVIRIFSGSVDLIVDAGNLPKRKPSTVFDVASRKIIRRGPVKENEILKCLNA